MMDDERREQIKITLEQGYCPELADKILQLSSKIASGDKAKQRVIDALLSMGPGCEFQGFKNQDEALGYFAALDWIERTVDWDEEEEPGSPNNEA